MNPDPGAGVPSKYFTPGQTWAKMFATAEEGSYQSGSTQYSNKIAMRDSLGKIKKMYEVTDYATEEYLAVAYIDSRGQTHNKWVKYAEVEFHQQWLREIDRALFYNRKDNTIKGGTGRPVDSFAGIQQKLEESGNNHVHSGLRPKLIQEYFMDIFYSRVKLEELTDIVGFTGYYGMMSFHEMMNAFVQKEGWLMLHNNFSINKTQSNYHKNAFRYGYKFTEWQMPMGGTFKLVHNPIYDDRMINREIDPVTGYPLESQRITFLDFSKDAKTGNSNFRVVNKRDGFKFWYVGGAVSPFGPMRGTQGSSAREGYEMHYSKELGVHLQDPTAAGELILCRN
jgi:hypothetical protein